MVFMYRYDFVIFRSEGKFPVEKDMSLFRSFQVFASMLFGTDDLRKPKEDIIRHFNFC